MKGSQEDISFEWFRGKRVTVMGLGVNQGGLGVSRWLLRRGARLTVTDLKSRSELSASVAGLLSAYRQALRSNSVGRVYRPKFVLGRHDESDFTDTDLVIRNPAVPDGNPFLAAAKRAGVRVETDMAIFFLLCPVPILGISGTKGKSTVTSLVGEIMKRHDRRTVVAGNIRRSPLDDLDRLVRSATRKGKPVPVVLELSSWHLEGLERHRVSPHVAVLTNILEDHLNRYRGMAGYARAKSLIVAFQHDGDFAVLNGDDQRVSRIGLGRRSAAMPFGGQRFMFSVRPQKGDGCFVRSGMITLRESGVERPVLPVSEIRLVGEHNLSNVLAACAAARKFGVPIRTIAAAVRSFRGVPGRLETVAVLDGVRYVNDTTATMPDASIAAMRAMQRKGAKTIILAGGADKKLRFGDWGRAAARMVSDAVMLDGTATPKMMRSLRSAGFSGTVTVVSSMAEAVRLSAGLAGAGDTVLLSPGCASFGLFVNEFDRGDQFSAEVKNLSRKRSRRR
ncbi:MAG: UDP-N-acetylmuramoyl-L-alanine--D-glutamate ligase [bacterium]